MDFFISLVLGNIFWVFAFLAAAYFFGDKKRILLNFVVLVALVFSFFDLLKVHNLTFYTGTSLALLYIARLAVLSFLESTKKYRSLLPLGYSFVTYTVLLFYNFFPGVA